MRSIAPKPAGAPRNAKGANFSAEEYANLARLLRAGKRNGEILKVLGVKYRTFYDRMARANVTIGERRERFLVDATTGEELTPERILEIASKQATPSAPEVNDAIASS